MTIVYTSRSIWFNGLCGSQLHYDSVLSTKEFVPNLCSTVVYPWTNS